MKTLIYIKPILAVIILFVGMSCVAQARAIADTVTRFTYYGNHKLRTSVRYDANGKRDGITYEYYDNGQLKTETPYEENVKNGVEREYYEDGQLKSETTFTDGIAGAKTMYKRRIR